MVTFEQFVAAIGDDADNYSADELKDLYVDAQRFAHVVIAIVRTHLVRPYERSPQQFLYAASGDRTLENMQPE